MRLLKRTGAAVLALILALSLMTAALADTGYTDVSDYAWFAEDAVYCREKGLMLGTGAAEFSPDKSVNRGMFVTVLYRIAGEPAVSTDKGFADVPESAYCARAAAWAAENGVAFGYEDGSFKPDKPINREQMACLLARFALLVDAPLLYGPVAELHFDDLDEISDYAMDSVNIVCGASLMRGFTDGCFRPQATATRAEAAALFARFYRALERELPATLTVYREAADGATVSHRYMLPKTDAETLEAYLVAMERTEDLHAEFAPTHVLDINGVVYSFEILGADTVPELCNYSLGDDGEYGILKDPEGSGMSAVAAYMLSFSW